MAVMRIERREREKRKKTRSLTNKKKLYEIVDHTWIVHKYEMDICMREKKREMPTKRAGIVQIFGNYLQYFFRIYCVLMCDGGGERRNCWPEIHSSAQFERSGHFNNIYLKALNSFFRVCFLLKKMWIAWNIQGNPPKSQMRQRKRAIQSAYVWKTNVSICLTHTWQHI